MHENPEASPTAGSSAVRVGFRLRTYVLLGVLALLLAELATYALWGENAAVAVALRSLPETGRSDFVCLVSVGLSPVQEAALVGALRARFTAVYRDRDEIPPDRLIWTKTVPAKLLGFDGGFLWSWVVRQRGWLWFTAENEWWASNTGAEWQRSTYIWVLGTWVRVWAGPCAAA